VSPDIQHALQHATRLYLTTSNRRGQSGTVPIWFFLHEGAIYFCTRRTSLKVRRMQQTGRATVHIAHRSGPELHCTAHILEDAPDLQALLLRTYRTRYRWRWLLIGPRLRRAFARGTEVMVQLLPQSHIAILLALLPFALQHSA
jgi:PPOX class probable F420-dependent enzyme